MTPLLDYLLKLSISLAVVGLFYQLVLRRHTFYTWNRWYLLGYSALAFVLPFIDLNRTLPPADLAKVPLVQYVPTLENLGATQFVSPPAAAASVMQESSWTLSEWMVVLLMVGVVFMFLRLLVHGVAFLRIKRRAQLVSDDSIKIYHVERNIVPFSFGNAIFINPTLHQESELHEIMLHELVHVRQRHTLDILFGEVLCALNWYNPFAWLIRHAIRQNLEFIADRAVLEKGVDARAYQFLLLKVAGVPEFHLANQFNFSSLKQRILMMNRTKSAQVYLVRFLYALPMLLVLLAMFRTDMEALGQGRSYRGSSIEFEADHVYLAGIFIDGSTGQPIANLKLEGWTTPVMTRKGEERPKPKLLATITTDADGFYFWKVDTRNQDREYVNYSLKPTEKRYEDLTAGGSFVTSRSSALFTKFDVLIYTENLLDRLRRDHYSVLPPDYSEKVPTNLDAGTVKQLIQERIPEFMAEHTLKIDFKKAHWKPRDVITKFGEGYFNKDRELFGYVADTEFFLDGKPATYEEINREFKQRPIALSQGEHIIPFSGIKGYKKIYYQTFRNFENPPPAELVTDQNVEWVPVTNFDVAILEKEPYMLDGFRQVPGTSSNLMPLKGDIVRVAILKNKLARYYAPKLNKLWWIETRPPAEVQGRPDFARR